MRSSSGRKGPGLKLTMNKDYSSLVRPLLGAGLSGMGSNELASLAVQNIIYDDYNQRSEKYVFPDPFVVYKIMPAQEDRMALDITSLDIPEEKLVKNNAIIWDYHGGPNQNFYLRKVDQLAGSFYYIISSSTGFVLEVPNDSYNNQVQVHVNPRTNSRGEIWQLVECGKDLYKLKSFCGKVLDISGHLLTNGNPVIQFQDNNGRNQKWKIWPA